METQENQIIPNTNEQSNKSEISTQDERKIKNEINENPNNQTIKVFTKPNERIKTKVFHKYNFISNNNFIFSITGCNKCKRSSFRRL